MRVAVTGATGLIGSRLVERLQLEGHQIVVFSRDATRARKVFPAQQFSSVEIVAYTPLESGDWQQSIAGCDGVVNLAGAPIAESRWTPDRKREILASRQVGTEKIVAAITQAQPRPRVLINASAIGYYGSSETATFTEAAPAGKDFLAEVCQAWEAAAQLVQASGTRWVIFRTGIVLGPGGAIAKLLLPFRLFAGGPLGTGQQWFSWIHREDMVNLILTALTDANWQGAFNATAPQPVRMAEFCQVLGDVIKRPSWLPVPGLALELLLGDAAKVVLEGQQVLPQRAQALGFGYEFASLKPALEQVMQQLSQS